MYNTIFYPYLKKNFFCEHLWFQISILQDGRIEPCSCASSQMEPLPPGFSTQDLKNNEIFSNTRKYLLEKMKASGKFPKADKNCFDCCLSCPVAPGQRFHEKNDYYFKYRLMLKRFFKNPLLISKKFNNLRKLISCANKKRIKIDGFPAFANIDVSTICNIRCMECDVGRGKYKYARGFMDFNVYQDILKEIGPYLFYLELYRYGEPLLHKDILKMIELAEKQYNILVKISTNFAMPLSEDFLRRMVKSGLSFLIIGADDIDQEHYKKYRKGGDVNIVINNLKNLIRAKKEMDTQSPKIYWQSLIFNFNEHRRDAIEKYVMDLGVNQFTFASPYLSPANYDLRATSQVIRGGGKNKKTQILSAKVTPAAIDLAENFTLEVEVINSAFKNEIPVSGKNSGVRVGIKLADKNKNELTDFERILFNKPLGPGENVNLKKEMVFHQNKNLEKTVFFKIDLVMEHQFWFEQNLEIQSIPYFVEVKINA